MRPIPARALPLPLVGLLAAGAGCGTPGASDAPATELVSSTRTVPLVSLARRPPESAGRPRWVGSADSAAERSPAILGAYDFTFSVARRDAARGVVRGRYGFVGDNRVDDETRARFRIRLRREGSTTAEETLFDETLASMESPRMEELALELPSRGDVASGGELVFEVLFESDDRPNRLVAAWVDPVLEVQEAIEVRRTERPWNVLLITSDTTRQDTLGSYGGTARTPALSRLASEGALFGNAFSVSYGTTPSHASLLTGSYARQHGVYDNSTLLPEELVTLPEVLKRHGYATAAFVSAKPLVRQLGFDQGFDFFDDVILYDPSSGLGRFSFAERRADVTTTRFLEWLGQERTAPFFAWVHFYDAHQPYAPRDAAARDAESNRDTDITKLTESFFATPEGEPKLLDAEELLERPAGVVEAVDRMARHRYDGEIEFIDGQMGRILRALEDAGLYEKTLVVFVADHGENLMERGARAYTHGGLHHDVTRLPLIVKLPESRAAESRRDFLLESIDVAPTILDALDIDLPAGWSGRSFLALLAEDSAGEFREHVFLEGAHRQEVSVRTRAWMYRRITEANQHDATVMSYLGYREGMPVEIYDLTSDPLETTRRDVGTEPMAQVLDGLVRGFLAQGQRGDGETLLSPEHRRALEALGYTQ